MQATSALIWSDDTKARFAALVRKVLERERISQETLAKQIGVTQGTISLWTKGAIKTTPSQAALASFANFCEMTLDEVAIHLGLADRKKINIAEIKVAIAQTDMDEAIALQDALTKINGSQAPSF